MTRFTVLPGVPDPPPWALEPGDPIPPLTVRLKSLDGGWETAGVDRYPAVVPESLRASVDLAGPSTCSFELRRRPGDIHPDLSAFTPCEVEVGSLLVWSGRVRETPTQEGTNPGVSVEGQGWQFHADDDAFRRSWVHARMSDWRDAREVGANYDAGPEVEVGNKIRLAVPVGSSLSGFGRVGAVLDLGSADARHVVLQATAGGAANLELRVFAERGMDLSTWTAPLATALTTYTVTFPAPRRYIYVALRNTTGAVLAGNLNSWFEISYVAVSRESADLAADGASLLKASKVVRSARELCPLLSPSDERIVETTFSLPEFHLDGHRTPREAWEAVNAVHHWRLGVDAKGRAVFGPPPVAPEVEVGEHPGAEFQDASSNSAEEIYNVVAVEGRDLNDQAKVVERTTADVLADTEVEPLLSPALANPSADVDASGWSILHPFPGYTGDGAVSRDTTVYDSAPASLLYTSDPYEPASGAFVAGGEFEAGATYRLRLRMRASEVGVVRVWMTDGGAFRPTVDVNVSTSWATVNMVFVPRSPVSTDNLTLRVQDGWLEGLSSTILTSVWLDSIRFERMLGSLPDRYGFRRARVLTIDTILSDALGAQIGDAFLRTHSRTPLRGSLSVVGRGGVRRVLGGAPVAPHELLLLWGERVRLSHRVDPDTGGWGRDGTIAAVEYSHAEQRAQLTIDNARSDLEALLARLAIVNG